MFFGQLLYIVVIPIPESTELKMKKPEDLCLAIIWQVHADLPNAHGILPILSYKHTGALDPADIKSIQCVVSRVKDQRKWGLINCSGPLAHVVFTKAD